MISMVVRQWKIWHSPWTVLLMRLTFRRQMLLDSKMPSRRLLDMLERQPVGKGGKPRRISIKQKRRNPGLGEEAGNFGERARSCSADLAAKFESSQ